MSELNLYGPWIAAMRRRVKIGAVGFVLVWGVAIASGLLVCLVALALSRGRGPAWLRDADWLTALPVLLALVILSAVLFASRLVWRERTILRLVPAHDGLICPRCLIPLTQGSGETTCARCRRSFGLQQVREYWDHYPRGALWFVPVMAPLDPLGRHRRIQTGGPLRSWRKDGLIIAVVVLFGMISSLFMPGTFVVNFTSELAYLLPILLVLFGSAAFSAYRRREGVALHCAKCGYQQAPQGETSLRCPECGAYWSFRGGTVRGRPTGRPWMLWLAVVMWIVGGTLLIAPFLPTLRGLSGKLKAWQYDLLPNSVLIRQLISQRGYDDNEWAALNKRKLSPDEATILANGLLDKRSDRGYFSRDDETWFVAQLNAKSLPQTTVARYYHEMLRLWLSVPATPKVGAEFRVSIGSETHLNVYTRATGAHDEALYFAGFYVGAAPGARARGEHPIYAIVLDHPKNTPSARVTADRPGPLRIRAVAWFVVAPAAALNARIQWQADGTPVLPTNAEWSERIDLEETVQVVE